VPRPDGGERAGGLANRASVTADIVILDISMPVMDGCELAQRIRADDHLSKMPLVAVTAFGSGWQQAALACGCTSVLERPTDLPVFERAVRAALGGQSSRLVPFARSDGVPSATRRRHPIQRAPAATASHVYGPPTSSQ